MRDKADKKYTNGEITVVWKPALCIHSALCWKGLNAVFDPNKRPWITMAGASSEEIIAQVDKCPSGALSWFRNDAVEKPTASPASTIVEIVPNGPLLVRGEIVVKDGRGDLEKRGPTTSFCRCGHSGNKPYCDGSHTKVGFRG